MHVEAYPILQPTQMGQNGVNNFSVIARQDALHLPVAT